MTTRFFIFSLLCFLSFQQISLAQSIDIVDTIDIVDAKKEDTSKVILGDDNADDTIIKVKDIAITKDTKDIISNLEDAEVLKYNTLTPKRVTMYSALIPGMGQYKNKQYWKMPIVYVGLGVATYFVIYNQKEYNYYRSIFAGRLSNDPEAFNEMPEYNMETIRRARDYYRKNMELSVIFGVAGYGIQIIDALIFAHLKDFDISDDLSLRFQSPRMSPQTIGFALALKF